MKKNPFFIIGTKRGGTTLLRMMVNNHPEIAIPPESHFIIPMLKNISVVRPLDKREQKQVRSMIIDGGRFNTWSTTEEELEILFDQFPAKLHLREILDAVFRLEISKDNKTFWGDKTPEYIDIIDGLGHIFPKARFIFLIRDGRDVINSLKSKGWEGWSVFQRSNYWAKGVQDIFHFMAKGEHKCMLIKYEDLVQNSAGTLRRICFFLDVDYSEAMLEYYLDYDKNITQVERENNIHTKLSRLPSTSDIEKWRKSSLAREIFLAESVMYREMEQLSYALAEFNPRNPMHQLKALAYHLVNMLNGLLYFGYHKVLNGNMRALIRNTVVGKTLRKFVRST